MNKLLSAPREHHYVFVHRAVRDICLNDPLHFFSIISSEQQNDFMKYIWDAVNESIQDKKADFNFDEIKISIRKIKNFPTIVLIMPEPKAATEAYFVCIVLKPDNKKEGKNASVDYFTLELGQDIDGSLYTVLCKWEDQTHFNLGNGPKPELQNFLAAIENQI